MRCEYRTAARDSLRSKTLCPLVDFAYVSRAQAIAHGVSPNDHFSQGLSLALRERWPAMYQDFRHFEKTKSPHPGTLWAWIGADGKRIVNLFTQEAGAGHGDRPGRAALSHVGHALRELHKFVVTEKVASLALPRIATGVGGLDWKDVQPLVAQPERPRPMLLA